MVERRPTLDRKRIERLTPKQQARLASFREDWRVVGLDTARADRARAERAITSLYAEIGKPAPRFLHVASPAQCLVMLALRARAGASPLVPLGDSLWERVEEELGVQLEDQLADYPWNRLLYQIWRPLRDQLWDQLRSRLQDQLRDDFRERLEDRLAWGRVYTGQHDATWIAFYMFAREELGCTYDDRSSLRLDLWAQQARTCGWWWPFEGLVIVSDRPSNISFDDRLRLHNDRGPAVLFRDGYGLWAVHGVRVPREVIESPEKLKAEAIAGEGNAEVRRVMIERFGPDRYVRESGARPIGKDDWGTLWRADLRDDEPLVMVEVLNSTAEPDGSFRAFFLRVPPTMTSAREAVAWTFDLPEAAYGPAVQT
jgi:hypothetical protein